MHGASGGAASSESGLPPAFDVEAAKARLRRDGLVVIERAFAPNEVAEIKEALADVISVLFVRIHELGRQSPPASLAAVRQLWETVSKR